MLIDDLNPLEDPHPSGNADDLRVRAWVTMGGFLWGVYATVRARGTDGKVIVAALSIEPVWPAENLRNATVTARLLQGFPVELLARETLKSAAEEETAKQWAVAYAVPITLSRDEKNRIVDQAEKLGVRWSPPRGNRGTPRAFYDALAIEAIEIAGEGLAVAPELAKRHHKDKSTAKRWIRDAKRLGALDPRPATWRLGPDHPARKENA